CRRRRTRVCCPWGRKHTGSAAERQRWVALYSPVGEPRKRFAHESPVLDRNDIPNGDRLRMTSDPTRPSTSIDLRVRYAETDQMGVVYHANYLVWCEVARTDLIRRFYLPYSELERRGVLLAVSEASLRYRAPARYEDLIRVYATVTSVRSR